MRAMWLCIVAIVLQASDLPVAYDPFHTAQKIIQTKASTAPRATIQNNHPLHLYGIWNEKAFIDGKFYSRGAIIQGYRIVAILSDRVILQKNKKKKILTLFQKRILKVGKQ